MILGMILVFIISFFIGFTCMYLTVKDEIVKAKNLEELKIKYNVNR